MLRSNQLHPMPQRGEFSGKPVRATARLHCNGARFNLSRKLQQAIAVEALAQYLVAACIMAYEVKTVFTNVDA